MTRKRSHIAIAALPVAAYLTIHALLAGLYVEPPPIGWIGFAVVGAVGVVLAIGAAWLFPRMRTNVVAVPPGERVAGVVVLADARCASDRLVAALTAHIGGREVPVHVVAPILASPLHYLSGDEGVEREEARIRLDATLAELAAVGVQAEGSVGTDDPLQALSDALVLFPAAELVIVTERESHWLERRLLANAQRLVPTVRQLVVEREPALV